MKRMLIIPLLIAGLDQWIKSRVRLLPTGSPFFRVSGVFELIPSFNTGAAFSILRGEGWLLILISVLLLFFCIHMIKMMHLRESAVLACLLLIGGGLGNLIDRVLFGGVTDYIRLLFLDFPIFNFADIVITCSVLGLILLLMTNRLEESAGETHE